MIICLGPPLPAASSGSGGTERDDGHPCSAGRSPGLAPGRGLPSRHLSMPLVRSYRTLAPLPVQPPSLCPAVPSAVCFCGTVLTVARTGSYPAGLAIGEPGLSSTGRSITHAAARATPHRSRSPRLLSGVEATGAAAGGSCGAPSRHGPWLGLCPAVLRPPAGKPVIEARSLDQKSLIVQGSLPASR